MRVLFALALVPSLAHADVSVGAAVGAGAQGASTYSALELRLDGTWKRARLGLGVRGIWDGDDFRDRDWSSPARAITIVRSFEARTTWGDATLGVAAGALAPPRLGTIVDGYRVSLDDSWRTGVRAASRSQTLDVGAEIDDVLDPVLIGAGVRWQMAPPWGMHASVAVDPAAPAMRGPQTITAIEAGVHRRYEGEAARADVGVSVVAEISLGASAVVFAESAIARGKVTWSARADVRAGTGSIGTLFGPLYRIERLTRSAGASTWDLARDGELSGASAGATIGGRAEAGWLELGARARPGLGPIVSASGGAPMGKYVQAGAWLAASERDAAGAAELRVAWANRLFSALQGARMYRLGDTLDAMDHLPVWSVTAWFGISSE